MLVLNGILPETMQILHCRSTRFAIHNFDYSQNNLYLLM